MSETSLVIQIVCLLLLILGYTAYLCYTRRKILKQRREDSMVGVSDFSGSIDAVLKTKYQDKLNERIVEAKKISDQGDNKMVHSITLASDVQLLECKGHLLIKASVQSIASICDEFAVMAQLPEGHCALLGDWKLFVLNDVPKSSREDKIVVMPRAYWLFMSCKLRDSIYGEELHPYVYVYEPFTFRKVLTYGIGVEASNYEDFNKEEID